MPPIDYDRIAEIYDLYAATELDVPFFLDQARRADGPVLELMAGTGRLSLPLLRAGLALVCVDASPGMLDVLRRKLDAAGLHAEVVCADVRALSLPRRFDLAILPFNAFMELLTPEDQGAALRSIAGCLRPGGRFVCTLHNPAVRARACDGALRLTGRFPWDGGALLVSAFERREGALVRREQLFEFFGADGVLRETRLLEMPFALIERREFEALAAAAGLRVVSLFGDYDLRGFDADTSPYLIWILEKPNRA